MSITEQGRRQLQEILRALDCTPQSRGDRHMAYYGQLRAEGLSHEEALETTIVHFNLRSEPWWPVRFPEEV